MGFFHLDSNRLLNSSPYPCCSHLHFQGNLESFFFPVPEKCGLSLDTPFREERKVCSFLERKKMDKTPPSRLATYSSKGTIRTYYLRVTNVLCSEGLSRFPQGHIALCFYSAFHAWMCWVCLYTVKGEWYCLVCIQLISVLSRLSASKPTHAHSISVHYWSPHAYSIKPCKAKPGSQIYRMPCPRVPATQGMLKNSCPSAVPAHEARRTDICVQRRDATISRSLLVKVFTV